MEYHWTPEPYLATQYKYWNPTLDERGRQLQSADAMLEEKRIPEAIALLEKLSATDTDGSTWMTLGNAKYHAGDRKGAAVAYARVPEKSASYKTAVYNLACSYAQLGDKPKALAALKKAIAAGVPKSYALSDSDLASIKSDIAAL
jgi:Flp pilus assembly protein TadD